MKLTAKGGFGNRMTDGDSLSATALKIEMGDASSLETFAIGNGDIGRENELVEAIMGSLGPTIKCPSCEKAGDLVKNGVTTTGVRALKCTACRKQVSGNNDAYIIVSRFVNDWNLREVEPSATDRPYCREREITNKGVQKGQGKKVDRRTL